MRASISLTAGLAGLVLLGGCSLAGGPSQVAVRTAAEAEAPAAAEPAPVEPPAALVDPPAAPADGGDTALPLLQAAPGGDGDSWRDTEGREYRLGLVNAPETNECFGAQATAERQARTAGGFRAQVYEQDRYGRSVALITTADGTNLNLHLARHGLVDDRYLARFRSENPALAAELDAAFAAARGEQAGLWGACTGAPSAAPAPPPPPAAAPAPPPAGDASCHPDYVTCIPVKGDGSGRGEANDLDCGDLRVRVQVRQPGVDPYRLDADGDGQGCESS